MLCLPGGYGNMTFTMDLYQSASYFQSYGPKDYPISVNLNDDLYVGYSVVSNEASLEVFAESCWATPKPNPYSMPKYIFIQDGWVLQPSPYFVPYYTFIQSQVSNSV